MILGEFVIGGELQLMKKIPSREERKWSQEANFTGLWLIPKDRLAGGWVRVFGEEEDGDPFFPSGRTWMSTARFCLEPSPAIQNPSGSDSKFKPPLNGK